MISLRSSLERTLYFLISLLINLTLFNLLYFFIVNIPNQNIESLPPLKVKIQEFPEKSSTEKTTKKSEELKSSQSNRSRSTYTTIPIGKEGKIPVKARKRQMEEVSLLQEIKNKALKRLEERKKFAKEVGEISAIVSNKKVMIRVGSRKLVYVPPAPTFKVKEFPSSVKVKIWVDPSGKVIKAIITQRSGIAEIDNGLLKFVKKLKFEPIEIGEIQEGIITFTFTAG